MQGPIGPKPAFSQSNAKPKNSRPDDVSKLPAKKRSKPKVKVSGDTDMSEEQEGASNLSIVTGGAKPRARKSDGDGGSKKRAKKADGEERPRHGGINGMLDDDEDSADRRAVENLVEAARGNIGKGSEQPAKVARKKNGGGNRCKGEKAASQEFSGEAGGAAAGVVGSSPQRGGAASFLGNFGMGALQIPGMQQLQQQQQQQMHDFHKRMEQVREGSFCYAFARCVDAFALCCGSCDYGPDGVASVLAFEHWSGGNRQSWSTMDPANAMQCKSTKFLVPSLFPLHSPLSFSVSLACALSQPRLPVLPSPFRSCVLTFVDFSVLTPAHLLTDSLSDMASDLQ